MAADAGRCLSGVEVAITGRLASMTRDEARARLAAAGAKVVPSPTAETDLVVVGAAGPPLARDGRPTRTLRRARELASAGAPLAIVTEEQLLFRLGLQPEREELARLYTRSQLARILGVRQPRIRSWVRHGLVRPARVVEGVPLFDFAQVASARALCQLAKDGVTAGRIRKSLAELSAWAGGFDGALGQLEVLERRGPLLVRLQDGVLTDTRGQLHLDFDEPAPAPLSLAEARAGARFAAAREPEDESETWFERGIQLEEAGRVGEAAEAYCRSLEEEGPEPEVYFNLGNVLLAAEDWPGALSALRRATELDAEYVEAWNNLGIVLAYRRSFPEAERAFRRALALEPNYADAHYNLAESLASRGKADEARRHWQRFLEFAPPSPSTIAVRAKLTRSYATAEDVPGDA